MKPGKQLRRSLHGGSSSLAASARSPLSAALVEEAGFPVVWASGLELSVSRGTPDANVLTMTDVVESSRQIAEAVSVPVLADCDSGFGGVGNVMEMVRQFERAGVGGVCVEDKIFPKVNSFAGAGRISSRSTAWWRSCWPRWRRDGTRRLSSWHGSSRSSPASDWRTRWSGRTPVSSPAPTPS